MVSRRVFYRFLVLPTAVLLAVAGPAVVSAQGPATTDQQLAAPADTILNDPAAAAQAQALQGEPALPDIQTLEAAAAAAAAETGTAVPTAAEVEAATGAPVAQTTTTTTTTTTAAPVDPNAPLPLTDPSVDPTYKDAVDQATQDALPISRMRINTEGFELGGTRKIDVYPGDDPSQDNEALQAEIRQEAFDAATTGLFPLAPADIKKLLQQYDDTERAAQSPPYDLPTPEVVVQTISMDPGVAPPTIKTAVGHVTTVNMLDMTGAPWPVQDITWAGDFEIVEPEEGGHIIRITPMAKFTYGNMSVRLLTLKTPITFSLRVERDTVHYRVDARVPEFGPFANAQIMEGGMQLAAGSPTLTSVLDGVPPTGAVKLAVSGVDGRTSAYKIGATTYVRTPLTLLSPGWQSSVSSADGMNVYAMEDTPVLLLSDQGQFLRAKLSEERDLFDEQ
jgi:intracellular multiplication protein IcmK